MADQLVDGAPAAKRQRRDLASPSLTPASDSSEFSYETLVNIANELPDELTSTSDGNHNALCDQPTSTHDSTAQNNQQLSHLLSSSTPPSTNISITNSIASPQNQNATQGRNAGLVQQLPGGGLNVVNKSSHMNMSSVLVGKQGTLNPQHMMNISDTNLINTSAAFTVTSSGGTNLGAVSSSMNMKPLTPQQHMIPGVNLSQHNPNQPLMNGPSYSQSGIGQARNVPSNTVGNTNAMPMSQGNVMGQSINISQLAGHQNLGHPGINSAQSHQQIAKSVPQGGGGASAFNFSSAPGPGHPPSTASFTTPLSTAMTSMTSSPMNAGSTMTNPGQPVQPGTSRPGAADPDKSKLIQQQLVLLLHAHKCQRREATNGEQACSLPYCRTMKNVLNHMTTCSAGKACQVAHCASSRQIITHWKNCTRSDCPVCLPLKHASDRRNTTAQNTSMAPSNTQTVTAAVSTTVGVKTADPATMKRAYDALGLQYNSTGTTHLAPSAHPQINQGMAPAQINSTNQSNPIQQLMATQPNLNNPAANATQSLPPLSDGLATVQQPNAQISDDWHQNVTQDLRNHLVHKLVQAIFPTPEPAALKDSRMKNLVAYARKVEGDMYETANSREEYYHLLAEKIYKIQKELDEKRIQRMMRGGNPSGPNAPAAVVGPARQAGQQSVFETLGIRAPSQHFDSSLRDVPVTGGNQLQTTINAPNDFNIAPQVPQIPSMQRMPLQNMSVRTTPPPAQLPLGSNAITMNAALRESNQQLQEALKKTSIQQPISLPQNQAGTQPGLPQQPFSAQHQGNQSIPAQSQPLPQPQRPVSQPQPSPQQMQSQPLQQFQQQQQNAQAVQQPVQSKLQQQLQQTQQMEQTPAPQEAKVKQEVIEANQHLSSLLSSSTPPPSSVGATSAGQMMPSVNSVGAASNIASTSLKEIKQEVKSEMDTDFKTEGDKVINGTNCATSGKSANNNAPQNVGGKCIPSVEVKMETQDSDSNSVPVKEEQSASASGTESSTPKPEGMDNTAEASNNSDDSKNNMESPAAGTATTAAAGTAAAGAVVRKPNKKKVFKPDELRQALMPTLEKLYRQDPESLPFRQPVDPIMQQIPDYFEIIKKPIDLSMIKRKLDTGQYQDPWEYVDDVWLMFENAWVYNKKTSRVYKYCTKLSEVFESEIDGVMQSLGYCCGHKYVFSPQVLCCYGKQLCTIPRDVMYYCYQNRVVYCEKCFQEIQGDEIEVCDDPTQPASYVSLRRIPKTNFDKLKNDKLEYEDFINCLDCGRKLHRICCLWFEPIWPQGYTCDNCLKAKGMKRKENKYGAKRLPNTKLGTYLENRVNNFLRKKDVGAGEVSIRVLSSSDKVVEVKQGMKKRFGDEFQDSFVYRSKSMFAFEEIDGTDVCFFGMHVQEYGSESPAPNTRRVYISYLDSVHFFRPRALRTAVYHEVLIGYLEYVKNLGFTTAHIWACPPSEGDDYIFHCHPPEQKIPKPKRLQEWYKKMLDKAIIERCVTDYKDILKDAIENNFTSAKELPYFEGDFWPNVLEECIKELDQEEEEKRKREEAEAAAAEAESQEVVDETGDPVCALKGEKKGRNKKASKSKNNQRKNSKKTSLPYGGNDLTAKIYQTMEKHKEVFFVIRLRPQANHELPPIVDPDPHISNELMDGRDSFLTMAREKHFEFSSLRRAKLSTMALLYELHNQGRDSFVYTCNSCKTHVETRYHCQVCDDFDLCTACFKKEGHPHKMDKLGLDLDDGSYTGDKQENPQESRRQSIQRCIQSLVHACQCRDANCRLHSCQKMKRVVAHTKSCRRKTNGCPICKQLIALCCYHAKHCDEHKCQVPFCHQLKHKLRQQQLQQRLQQAQMLRRRMALMTANNSNATSASVVAAPQVAPQLPVVPSSTFTNGKPSSTPPQGAMEAAMKAQEAAQAQRQLTHNLSVGKPTSVNNMQQPKMPNPGIPVNTIPSPQVQQRPPIFMHQQQQYPTQQQMPQQQQVAPPRQAVDQQMSHQMQQSVPSMNPGMNSQQQRPSNQMTNSAIQQLLQALKNQSSTQTEQKVLAMLKQNPALMASVLKLKTQRMQQQQQQAAAQQQQVQNISGMQVQGMPPQNPQLVNPPTHQQLRNLQLMQQMRQQQAVQQQAAQQQAVQQQQQQQQHQMNQFQQPMQPFSQRQRMNFPPRQGFQNDGTQHHMHQFQQQQQMMQVQHHQAQLKQQVVGGQPMSPQMMVQANPSPQQLMQQVRSPPAPSTLPQTVRSPQPIPSPRQQPIPSPRQQPQQSPHHVPTINSPHPVMAGSSATPDPSQMNSDQVMLPQLQSAHTSMLQSPANTDLMNTQDQDMSSTIPPQDQLSRYVETL
ncbi:CREB-binding protein-like isoform X4 [Gigantopelta aegis]|uniref:CREB-binding protein-like isoform X4 n=1 Tax=Gigantopelta aegis TaxID=1735272 RepID=UPI001B88BB69|nr:CREB-binding protein-like isoform X4 [Gigantopelta aegis]